MRKIVAFILLGFPNQMCVITHTFELGRRGTTTLSGGQNDEHNIVHIKEKDDWAIILRENSDGSDGEGTTGNFLS